MGVNNYATIKVSRDRAALTIQLNLPETANAISVELMDEMMSVLLDVEKEPDIKCIILEGLSDVFCTGMDFGNVQDENAAASFEDYANKYYDILAFLSLCSKAVIAKVTGKVLAGGIGLVAASDIVIAGEEAVFALPEALFGLLPACVMPFLIRRTGAQKAQWMSLMTQAVDVERALQIGLVDEVSKTPADSVRRCLLRLGRLETGTIKELKNYTSKLWLINEETRQLAVSKISSLALSEKVRQTIGGFISNGKLI
ncbi:enoyl-CoA hydratase-related protein [Chitinophaga sp. 22536]|uniref:enoyl-CoA hydratase-related protein n=1 Tax=unclassified Chitinophaga TaxID=2619133 RepID=UPI003F83B5A9